jgi:hypothetical protein
MQRTEELGEGRRNQEIRSSYHNASFIKLFCMVFTSLVSLEDEFLWLLKGKEKSQRCQAGSVAQAVECLQAQRLEFKPQYTKK